MIHAIRASVIGSLVVMAALVGCCAVMAGTAVADDIARSLLAQTSQAQSGAQVVPVQQACQPRNQACGAGYNVGPCCDNLWCQNGSCQPFQQVGQPCGTPATPPCQPGLACNMGACQQPN